MPPITILLVLFITSTIITPTTSYEDAEFEMFDLVEEVGQNFYDVLEIPQDSTQKDIKQAYRRLSLKLHPDKNPAEDASLKFRQLVGIYEVLKDPDLRISYNQVLVNGLPNWRHPSYYYRRVRKLELWQVGLIVLTIVSLCQYFGKYASYWEKKLAFQEQIDVKMRRIQRSRKLLKEGISEKELQEDVEKLLQKPSIYDLAPFQICRGMKYLVLYLPGDIRDYVHKLRELKEQQRVQKIKELEEAERIRELEEEPKKPRKRKVLEIPEKEEGEAVGARWNESRTATDSEPVKSTPPPVSGGLWTDDDISELVRLCSRYPGGTPERWATIAGYLARPVPEVAFMAKKVLERLSSKPDVEEVQVQPKVKVKTKGDFTTDNKVQRWSGEEQKNLEAALLMYPKGSLERWEKIGRSVQRSKEDCIARYKYLVEEVRKSKEKMKEVEENDDSEKLDQGTDTPDVDKQDQDADADC